MPKTKQAQTARNISRQTKSEPEELEVEPTPEVASVARIMDRGELNNSKFNPIDVLNLQRTMGNQLVMRLLARKEAGEGFTAVKHFQKPKSPVLTTGSTVQRWNRFKTEGLPWGGNSGFTKLADVHFSYIADKRDSHTQLHITFSDSQEPEKGETRKTSRFLWYNTETQTWTWAGANPCDDAADIEYYKVEALKWAKETEDEYLAKIPKHSRPANEFE